MEKDKKTCGHGPTFGQAVGDILTYPEKFDQEKVKRIKQNIINNSTLFPNADKTKEEEKKKKITN